MRQCARVWIFLLDIIILQAIILHVGVAFHLREQSEAAATGGMFSVATCLAASAAIQFPAIVGVEHPFFPSVSIWALGVLRIATFGTALPDFVPDCTRAWWTCLEDPRLDNRVITVIHV